MSLMTIAEKFEEFAATSVQEAVDEGKELAGKIAADVEDSFLDLVEKIGGAATKLVTALFSDDSLSGLEKANLAATQLVEHATQSGITLAEQDVTAIIKSAYIAVKNELSSL